MTSRGPLWRVSIETTREAEEAVTELLQDFFGQPASSYMNAETGEVTVMVYLSSKCAQYSALGGLTRYGVRPSSAAARFQHLTAENYQPARSITLLRTRTGALL